MGILGPPYCGIGATIRIGREMLYLPYVGLLRQTGLWEPNPPKNVQVFLQILNPVKNAEILAPELLGGQSEMVV